MLDRQWPPWNNNHKRQLVGYLHDVNNMIRAYPRVLKLLGQQVSAQKDSGIMELNTFLIGRPHNNRRPTGSRLLTLFIVQKSSLLQWPNFTKWLIELTTSQLSKQPNVNPLSVYHALSFHLPLFSSPTHKKLCSLKSNYEIKKLWKPTINFSINNEYTWPFC